MCRKPLAGEPMKRLVGLPKGRRVFVMQCGFHASMESWGLAMETPCHALTDKDGRFKIAGIPPGACKMVVWHSRIGGVKELIVIIQPKEQTKADMKIHAPAGRLYANRMVDKPYDARYGITNEARSRIAPTLIRQTP